MPAPDSTVTHELLPAATRRLVRTVDALSDEQYAEPSGLPGWSRAHVAAHLVLNAEGLAGTLIGIVTGRDVPMYRSQEDRDADIEALAGARLSEIRSRFLAGCTHLADAIDAVPDADWDTVLKRTPDGARTFKASAVPGMRLREVEIHHVDLLTDYTRASWPLAFSVSLVEQLATRADASGPFTAKATDTDLTVTRGEGGPTVTGTAADLGWWLTGRGGGEGLSSEDGDVPRIGAW